MAMIRRAIRCTVILTCLLPGVARAQDSADSRNGLRFRFIGPVGNRISAVAGVAGNPLIYYAGAASGGVFKTIDAGTHWKPIFDREPVMSIGAIAVSPSNPDIVWVGTGEPFIRSNVSIGWGVYKSLDGGRTWTCMGLEQTARIARIVIDPHDPDRVFVAALGHGYGPQHERGVFRTMDGGVHWTQVLFVNDSTGASDIVMKPNDPQVLYAGTWQFVLHTWTRRSGGAGSGLWKSVDGGTSWHRLTSHGLPTGVVGKVGLGISRASPDRIYALIETADGVPRDGVPQDSGRLWRSDDAGANWRRVSSDFQVAGRTAYYSRMAVMPDNANEVYFAAADWSRTLDGGATIASPPRADYPGGDQHDIWIDPVDPNRFAVAHDHGVSLTLDRGRHWRRIELPVGQLYHVTVDDRIPYRVYANLQDGPSLMGPSNAKLAPDWSGPGIPRGLWRTVGGDEDGWATPDPVDTNLVWSSGSGYGSLAGAVNQYDVRTGYAHQVQVWPKSSLGSPAAELRYRFGWTFPLTISPHDHHAIYVGSQYVHLTTDDGQTWRVISPDLTLNDKTRQQSSGGLTPDNVGVEYGDVIFSIAESPLTAGLLWVGTNDGLVQLTRDGGKSWRKVSGNLPGLLPWSTITSIEPSRWDAATAYLTVDAHQENNRDAWVYKTTDYGRTWSLITNGLPDTPLSYAHVIREDPVQRGLLYLGTEGGLYVSHDDGSHWAPLQLNLPRAPVYWLTVQERFDDLVVATYGRGIWILDDLSPIRRDLGPLTTLFPPRPTYRFRTVEPPIMATDDPSAGEQPPLGAAITYWLPPGAFSGVTSDSTATLVVRDTSGTIMRVLHAPASRGVNRVWWDLFAEATTEARIRVSPEYASWFTVPPEGRPAPGIHRFSALVSPGRYMVTLRFGGVEQTKPLVIVKDPASGGSDESIRVQAKLLRRITSDIDTAAATINYLESIRLSIARVRAELVKVDPAMALRNRAKAALDQLDQRTVEAERLLFQTRVTGRGQDFLRWPMRVTEQLVFLAEDVSSSDYAPTAAQAQVYTELHAELLSGLARASEIAQRDVPSYNAVIGTHQDLRVVAAP